MRARERNCVTRSGVLLTRSIVSDFPVLACRYNVQKKKAEPTIISISKPKYEKRPARFQTVVPSKFKKEKLLGQGGQGTVHLGTYEGVKVAYKMCVEPQPTRAGMQHRAGASTCFERDV